MRARPSLAVSLRNMVETMRICMPTVVEAATGQVDRSVCDARLAAWWKRVVTNAHINLRTSGLEHVGAGPYVLMSNHQSHYDVPILYAVLGSQMRMIAKQELRAVPVFGKAAEAAGFVFVDRSHHERALQSLGEAAKELSQGVSIYLAPEGTRSLDGNLGPFKKGGFMLAMQLGMPILPISIQGTRHVLPSGTLRSTPGRNVKVVVHPSVDPTTFSGSVQERRDALMAVVRTSIQRGLG